MDDVYISRTGVNKLTIRKGKKLPAPDENVGGKPHSQLKSNERSSTNVANTVASTYHVFANVNSWPRDPSPTGESSSSSSVGGLSVGGTLLKCSISEMSPSSLVLPSPKDSGVDVNSPCHRGDEEGVMSLGGIAHVVDSDNGVVTDVGSDRCRRTFVTASADPGHRGGGPRNSSNESVRTVVKESRSKSTKLDPSRERSTNDLEAVNQSGPPSPRTQSPLVIKRHRDSTRVALRANSDEGKASNTKSVAGSTDANSRDIYSFGGADSISPTAKVTKARRVQRPTNLPNFTDQVPADSEPTPARMGFRFFSGDRRRSNVADNAAVRLLREFTGVNNGEKKSVDRKKISSDKPNNAAPVVAPTTTVDAKESARKYTLVPVEKPDANKLIIKFSMAGQRGAMGSAASGQCTPVHTNLTGKLEPALLTVKKARSSKLAAKGSLLAVSNKNSLKGKSKGLASSRSIDRLASMTDKSSVLYPGVKKLADGGGSQVIAVRDPLLEATYRPRPARGPNLTTSTVKDPVTLGSKGLSTSACQSQSVVDLPSTVAAKKKDTGDNVVQLKTADEVETPAISSKSKQFYSADKQHLPVEKILSENPGNVAIKCKADDTRKTSSFIISLKTTTTSAAKLTEETGAIGIAQTGVEKTNSDVKNVVKAVDEIIETPKNTAVCLNSVTQAPNIANVIPKDEAAAAAETNSDKAVTKVDELKDKVVDELKVPPLTINKISLSIKRGSAGSWYVPESSKERRRERKLKNREKDLLKLSNDPRDRLDDRQVSSGAFHNVATTTEQRDPPSFSFASDPLSIVPLSLERHGESEKLTNAEDVAAITPNDNFVKRALPNSSGMVLRDVATDENSSSTAKVVELNVVDESRQNDESSEPPRLNHVQSLYVSKEESVIRPEQHVRSNLDACVAASNVPDAVNAPTTSINLTTNKKSKKHGKKDRKDDGSILPSVVNLPENVTKSTKSFETMETEVVPEKKTNVKLTRPWEDVTPSDTSAKLTTSTTVVSEFRNSSIESHMCLNNEWKSATSAFLGRDKDVEYCYSETKDYQAHLSRVHPIESTNFNFSNECRKSVAPYSFVASPKIVDADRVDSAGFIGESIKLNPAVVVPVDESAEKAKSSKMSSGDVVNGKRKGLNLNHLNGLVAKRSKVVTDDAAPSSLTELFNSRLTSDCASKIMDGNSHKLNGFVARLSKLNECSTTLPQERMCTVDTKVTTSFGNMDQTEENVGHRFKRSVTDEVTDARVNAVTEKSFDSISTDGQRSIQSDVSCRPSDTDRERRPGVSVDGAVSSKVNCVEDDENGKQMAVEFHSQLTEKVSSGLAADDRNTSSQKEVVHPEMDRPMCSPSQNETIVDHRTTLSETKVLSVEAICPISSASRIDSSTSHDSPQLPVESTAAAIEKSNRPIRRDKSTVKRKYIKEKVQPCELPLPTKAPAISTSQKSGVVCNGRRVELSLLENRITPKILESSSDSNREAIPFPKVQLNQNLSKSGDVLNDRIKEESLFDRKKRKDTDSNDKAPSAFDLSLSSSQSNVRDTISCFGRTSSDISKTVDDNADNYPRNRWTNSPYSFCLNDDSDNDVDDFRSCNINTPSPSSSPRSEAKDNFVFTSDKDRLSSFDSLYDDRISTSYEKEPAFKIYGEIYSSKATTKAKKQKVSSSVATDVIAQNGNIRELISDRESSKVLNCYQPDVVSMSLVNTCVDGAISSLETLTPPPSACEVALDLSDTCGIPPAPHPAIVKGDRFSREEDECLPTNELRTSSGAVLDIDAVSEFLNVDRYSANATSSLDPIECIVSGGRGETKNAKEDDPQKNDKLQEPSFSSDLHAIDTAYMDIISSLSLGDVTPFSDLSGALSKSDVGKTEQRHATKPSRELNESPSRSAEKLCRPWSDSDKAATVKDIEELEQQSRLFDNSNVENGSDTTENNHAGNAHCEYDPLDIDFIIRNICNGTTTNDVDTTAKDDSVVSDDRITAYNFSNNPVSSDLAVMEPRLEPLVLSSFDPSILCEPDDDLLAKSDALKNDETKNASPVVCLDVTTKDSVCSADDVKESITRTCVRENKDEQKEVETKAVPHVGYLGAFAKFLQCSDPVAFDQQSASSVDADEIKDETCDAAKSGSDNAAARLNLKQPTCRSSKRNKNRNLVESNYCPSPLSIDLEESRLAMSAAAGGNNQVTRRNSRLFRRSTLLKQMCRFRQDGGGSCEDEGTCTDSSTDQMSTRSNRSYNAGGTREKCRKLVKGHHLEQVNEEATLDSIKCDNIHPVTQSTPDGGVFLNEASVVAVADAAGTPIEESFVSVQLELAELEASVRLLFDVMFSGGVGGGMGVFSIIPKIFSASVSESGSSGVEQLLDAICTILAGGDDANDNNAHTAAKAPEDGGNRQLTRSDGVIILCNQPQSCLTRLKRKIATVLTLVLPDLAIDAEEILREENVGELLRMVISANTNDSSQAVRGSSFSSVTDARSDISLSQFAASKSSDLATTRVESVVPERFDAKRKLNGAGQWDSRTGVDASTKKTIPSECTDFTLDRSTSSKSRKKRGNKSETGKVRSQPAHSLSRGIPTEQDRTTRTT